MSGPLDKAVQAIGDIMDVTMVPFGNAQFQGGKLQCQHGPDECTLNSWEQCAIENYPKFEDYWPFYLCVEQSAVTCESGTGDPGPCTLKKVEGCATTSKLDYAKLSACVNDPVESSKLQHKFAGLTPANHQYTPWVLINKKVSSQSKTLIEQVCEAYTGSKPAGCSSAIVPANNTATCEASW